MTRERCLRYCQYVYAVGRAQGREWEAYGSLSMSCSVLAICTHCAGAGGAMAYWVLSSGELVRHNGLVPDSGVLRRHCGLWAACGGVVDEE